MAAVARLIAALFVLLTGVAAQMPQNPSPMVEHTRAHPRIPEQAAEGRREALDVGTLFVPAALAGKSQLPLLVFFHGGRWLPEVAGARHGMAVVSIQLGAGSGTYARAFSETARFPALLAEAERKSGVRFARVTVAGWSAGCGAIRELLRSPEASARIVSVLAIDGIHASYTSGKPGPLESQLDTAGLDVWVQAARDAIAGRKRLVITHSEIFPGTFASTTETGDYLVRQLGLRRRAVMKWGPMGTQQLSEVRAGRFLLVGFAGNSAPDHVDQLHSMAEYLKWLR